MRGYDPEEVDDYLDLMIKDYQTYQKYRSFNADNTRLFNKVEEHRQLSASDSIKN